MNRTVWFLLFLFPVTLLIGGLATFGNKDNVEPREKAIGAEQVKQPQGKFPVKIRMPDGPMLCATGQTDALGKPIKVRCMTCHAMREPDISVRSADALNTFHKGLSYAHGSLSCLSCHNGSDYDTFRLADGTALERRHVMTLCAQCHGTQMRDYQHGAHGGMTGHWDLSKGGRQRNHCLDCHDPHAPAFPKVQPVFKPKDRIPPVSIQEHE